MPAFGCCFKHRKLRFNDSTKLPSENWERYYKTCRERETERELFLLSTEHWIRYNKRGRAKRERGKVIMHLHVKERERIKRQCERENKSRAYLNSKL